MAPYERFDAFNLCHRLALLVYQETCTFPKAEMYGITAQVRRAAFSAPVNIVEGSAKQGKAEFRRFLDVALGSLAEVGYTIRFARELGLLGDASHERLTAMHASASKATWVLYNSMRRR